ncbi:hypothetical protein [Aureibacter tunicatorum]|uniref:Uncharacterized protein n=1 Tax=Aureibacter tunicatorum TaxID=866807 RepID=A0AAE3XMT6_9BACT|nr:hypothetical protein [Aureibacter tunicatorum]MDR6238651.1 hypothetical protein [Aureibacter tunicatorum]BDD05418.1 hypothetical protein AUTU_29010 [Aureibacter tunicatorum]
MEILKLVLIILLAILVFSFMLKLAFWIVVVLIASFLTLWVLGKVFNILN